MIPRGSPRFSLGAKAAIALAFGLIAIMVVLAVAQYRASSLTLSNEWEARDQEFAWSLGLTVQPLLAGGNLPTLRETVEHASQTRERYSVTVVDAKGLIVADSATRGLGQPLNLYSDARRQALEDVPRSLTWVEETDAGRTRYVLVPLRWGPVDPLHQTRVNGAILVGSNLSSLEALKTSALRALFWGNAALASALLLLFWAATRIGLVQVRPVNSRSLLADVGCPPSPGHGLLSPDATAPPLDPFSPESLRWAAVESLTAPIAVLDKKGTVIAANEAWRRLAAETVHPFHAGVEISTNYLDACRRASGEVSEAAREALSGIQAVLDGSLVRFASEYPCSSAADARWFRLSVTPLSGARGGAVVSHVDITEWKRREKDLREALHQAEHEGRRLDTLYATIPIGLLYVTPSLIVERVSQLIAEVQGRTTEDHIGRRLPELLSPERWARLKPVFEQVLDSGKPHIGVEEELRDPLAPDRVRTLLSDFYPDWSEDGSVRGIHWVMQEITAQKQALKQHEQYLRQLEAKNRELDQMAIRDPLTGLYNRRFFDEALSREWRRFQRTGEAFTVIIMDVDAFKDINDRHGHEAGDRALQEAGATLRTALRETDLVARVGGDEFGALLPGTDTDHSQPVIEKLRGTCRRMRLATASGAIPVSLSLGAATVPGVPPATSAAELLRIADKRMYDEKRLSSSRKPHTR